MAISLIETPADGILTARNRLGFVFSASAGETYIQVRVKNGSGTVIGSLRPIPFDSSNRATAFVESILDASLSNDDNTGNDRNYSGGVSTSTGGFTQDFTLEFRTDVLGSYSAIGSTYSYANAVQQVGNEPNLSAFDAEEGSGGSVTTQGAYLTKFNRRKLFWGSGTASPLVTDTWLFQQQFVYSFTDSFTEMTFRARWFNEGVLGATDSYTISANIADRGRHNIWQATRCFQYQEVIIDIISQNGDTIVEMPMDIVRVCNNPTAVKFLNAYGAWETWVFEGRSQRTLSTESIGEYSRYPSDLATATSTGRDYKKRAVPTVDLSADSLTLNEAQALEDLLVSPNVLIYVGDLVDGENTEDWRECKVLDGDITTYDRYNTLHQLAITLQLNEVYTLSN